MLTAAAAGVSAVANAITAAAPPPADTTAATRLGTSIQEDMTTRDRSAAQRARALDMREQAARAAEQRLKQAATPAPAAAAAGGGRGGAPAAEENRFDELARIYQAMKPKAAAVVFEQLAMDVQVEVAQRMRERATAGILAAMSPKGAAALTMAIARRQATPPPGASAQTAGR
jgi:flagellar motility protein MotE (MotC chaperone)